MMRIGTVTSLLLLTLVSGALAERPGRLALREHFGVSHPMQIVVFGCGEVILPKSGFLKCSTGDWTPFQLLSGGRVAVMTDLPAHAEKTWALADAKADGPGGEHPDVIPHAVRATRQGTLLRIENGLTGVLLPTGQGAGQHAPAPIQGIRYRDGTWTATGPNALRGGVTGPQVRWIESGPLKVVVELTYRGESGLYTSTVELQAGQPSILIEDEASAEVAYTLNVFEGLKPNEARYEGHHSTSVEAGREADGRPYRPNHERGNSEAIVDLVGSRTFPRMAGWDPWCVDTGYYWQMYDKDGPAGANLFGVFAGRASRLIGTRASGVNVYCSPGAAGIAVSYRRAHMPTVRLHWGIFLGVKGEDLTDPRRVQGINRQINLHAGINLSKLAGYGLDDYPDPARGYGAMYVPKDALDAMVRRVRSDEAFYRRIYADGYTRPLFDMWRDPSGKSLTNVVRSIVEAEGPHAGSGRSILTAMVHERGTHQFNTAYWKGAAQMAKKALWIDQVLAHPGLSAKDRTRVKAVAALFGGILWDDDFTPISNWREHGLNLGTPNMPVQYAGGRYTLALFLSEHPAMKARLGAVPEHARDQVHSQVNESGAHMGGTHYIGASAWPTINTLLQLKQAGLLDAFKTEERLARFAEFYMQLATPPEPRFAGRRMMIPTGDAEPDDVLLLCGMLGTGFAGTDAALSARLMGMWDRAGRPHDSFYGTTVVKVDERLPTADPALGSAHFPGSMAVLRSGWGTKHESALWLIAGDHYRDHRHNDRGEVMIYALSAPLSLDFGSMYSPRAPSALVKSVLAPADTKWRTVPAAFDDMSGNWDNSALADFKAGANGGHATAVMQGFGSQWTRAASLAEFAPDRPIFAIQDRFTGGPFVWSINLFCEDEIDTPEGQRRPGDGFALKPGVNRLVCTGQALPAHPSRGIDWLLYLICSQTQEGFLSQWSHRNHVPTRQVLLRIKGSEGFRVVIVPYPKGQPPDDIQVREEGGLTGVTLKGKTVRFDGEGTFAVR